MCKNVLATHNGHLKQNAGTTSNALLNTRLLKKQFTGGASCRTRILKPWKKQMREFIMTGNERDPLRKIVTDLWWVSIFIKFILFFPVLFWHTSSGAGLLFPVSPQISGDRGLGLELISCGTVRYCTVTPQKLLCFELWFKKKISESHWFSP